MSTEQEMTRLSDEELVRMYKDTDDNNCVGHLYKRYTHLVFGVCMKYLKDEDESKDAVMQIFEKLLIELKRHEIGFFKGWLHSVTKFHCLMLLRAGKKEIHGLDPAIMEIQGSMHPSSAPVEEVLEKERKLQLLEEAIAELDEAQQRCIRLFYLEEKSYQEVAEISGYNMNQVKSYIQNGKRNLKILMTKHEHEQ